MRYNGQKGKIALSDLVLHNPVLRKQRGVWFTPPQAVAFVVRAVNDIQQRTFTQQEHILTVLGNPPYNVSSCNKEMRIETLLADYKAGLTERNIQPLSDDYIKFIRLGQHLIEEQGAGILAYVTNNSFLDGIIHRQMRRVLTETFDAVYILNLHGSSRRKETAPDGKDENIFDIQQGVSINFFIKSRTQRKTKNRSATVFYADLYGTRRQKLHLLESLEFYRIGWQPLLLRKPYYFFVPKDFSLQKEYDAALSISSLFPLWVSGVKTHHDNELVSFEPFDEKSETYCYRCFDNRYIRYDLTLVERHRYSVMQHLLHKDNTALCVSRQQKSSDFRHVLAVKNLTDIGLFGDSTSVFPLYCYENKKRKANLNAGIVKEIEKRLGITIKPLEIFDYIYAILHSPAYRQRYREFLKVDFPHIPYPDNAAKFRLMVKAGSRLRKCHLFEKLPEHSPKNNVTLQDIVPVKGSGSDNVVRKVRFAGGKVWINETQYFGNVPESAWLYCMGNYQPAKKFLKDRKDRQLSFAEIEHYAAIIGVLAETLEAVKEIDKIYTGEI